MEALIAWFRRHARDLPWRRARDPYAIWVSEIMLQQTQAKTVVPYWIRWMRALPTIQALARARPEKVLKLWEGLGYYTRARNLQRAARIIVARHAGRFPEEFDDILALPGIGRYTAGAVCSIAFNQPRPVLDGNVVRVLTRLFGIDDDPRASQTNSRLWGLAQTLVTCAAHIQRKRSSKRRLPARDLSPPACSALNQALMELGAVICVPRRPLCQTCPVRPHCVAHRTNRVHEIPANGPRARPTPRRFLAFVIERQGRFLVRRRPVGTVNAGLWEFPNVEAPVGHADPARLAYGQMAVRLDQIERFKTIRHSITRHRITLEAYRARWRGHVARPDRAQRWLGLAQLNRLAFPSAHRRLVASLVAQANTGARVVKPDRGATRD